MHVGDNIRKARKALGMSQDKLAEAIGANRVTISKYESGRFLPSITALKLLAAVLKTTPNSLMGNDEQKDHPIDSTDNFNQDPILCSLLEQVQNAKPEHIRMATAMLKYLNENSSHE